MLDATGRSLLGGPGRFYHKLERAIVLVTQHLPASSHSGRGREVLE